MMGIGFFRSAAIIVKNMLMFFTVLGNKIRHPLI